MAPDFTLGQSKSTTQVDVTIQLNPYPPINGLYSSRLANINEMVLLKSATNSDMELKLITVESIENYKDFKKMLSK